MAMDHTPKPRGQGRATPRRTVLKGAAWSVPVVTVAASAPAGALVSPQPCTAPTQQVTLPQPTGSGANNTAAASSSLTIPAGVTEVSFVVQGAPGGGLQAYTAGARLTGRIAVTPGETLSFVTGQGGFRLVDGQTSNDSVTRTALGGQGHGSGGDASLTISQSSSLIVYGGVRSGGGASAILRGSTALVIAGGGGTGGERVNTYNDDVESGWAFVQATESPLIVIRLYPNGGSDSGCEVEALDGEYGAFDYGVLYTQGAGANPSTPAAVPPPGSAVAGTTFDLEASGALPGLPGGSASTAGSDGADGVAVTIQGYESQYLVGASGGGGGGYAGGASGAVCAAAYWSDAEDGGTAAVLTARGGRGLSYVASDVVLESAGTANNSVGNPRGPGLITLTYCPD